MQASRIVLVQLPELLREIIGRALLQAPEIQIAAEYDDLDQLARLCPFDAIEVVVVGVDRPEDLARLKAMLTAHPRVRALALTGAGRSAALWECVPRDTPLGELSTDGFVQAVQSAGRRSALGGASAGPCAN